MIPIVNSQKPTKSERHPLGWLWVHSIFYTIQGEGPFVGHPAVFVRLAGCNLQCPKCDTEYTEGAQLMDPKNIRHRIEDAYSDRAPGVHPLIVITGGEPFRQNLTPLWYELARYGSVVQIETNGTLYDPAVFEQAEYWENLTNAKQLHVVVSPKAGKIAIPYDKIDALKYVVTFDAIDPKDGLPTSVLGMPAPPARPDPKYRGPIYVQPADGPSTRRMFANNLNLQAAIDSCMRFGYRLCLQTHKIIDME